MTRMSETMRGGEVVSHLSHKQGNAGSSPVPATRRVVTAACTILKERKRAARE